MKAAAQLALPLTAPDLAGDDYIAGQSGPLPVRYVRHVRARRYVLRVDPQGVARVTMPRWGRRSEARAFAASHVGWIERQRARELQRPPRPTTLNVGTPVLVAGEIHSLVLASEAGRVSARAGDLVADVSRGASVRTAVVDALKARARRELPARLRELAESCRLTVSGITIRDQRTRWGSCGPTGHISLNWRLVQMPIAVRDYILYHELMHLRVRNHSPRFWRQVAQVCPEYQQYRRWLREHGDRLL